MQTYTLLLMREKNPDKPNPTNGRLPQGYITEAFILLRTAELLCWSRSCSSSQFCLIFQNTRISIVKQSISSLSEIHRPHSVSRVNQRLKVMEICHMSYFHKAVIHPLHTNTGIKHGAHEILLQYFQLLPLDSHSVIQAGLATFPVPWVSGVILIMHVTRQYEIWKWWNSNTGDAAVLYWPAYCQI